MSDSGSFGPISRDRAQLLYLLRRDTIIHCHAYRELENIVSLAADEVMVARMSLLEEARADSGPGLIWDVFGAVVASAIPYTRILQVAAHGSFGLRNIKVLGGLAKFADKPAGMTLKPDLGAWYRQIAREKPNLVKQLGATMKAGSNELVKKAIATKGQKPILEVTKKREEQSVSSSALVNIKGNLLAWINHERKWHEWWKALEEMSVWTMEEKRIAQHFKLRKTFDVQMNELVRKLIENDYLQNFLEACIWAMTHNFRPLTPPMRGMQRIDPGAKYAIDPMPKARYDVDEKLENYLIEHMIEDYRTGQSFKSLGYKNNLWPMERLAERLANLGGQLVNTNEELSQIWEKALQPK